MRHRATAAALTAALILVLPATALAGDGDRDHLSDACEERYGLGRDRDDSREDIDRDGLDNAGECRSGTSPRDSDTDRDGVRDDSDDSDGDGVANADEVRRHSNPSDADSDGDGLEDGEDTVLSEPQIDEHIFDEGPSSSYLGDARRGR